MLFVSGQDAQRPFILIPVENYHYRNAARARNTGAPCLVLFSFQEWNYIDGTGK